MLCARFIEGLKNLLVIFGAIAQQWLPHHLTVESSVQLSLSFLFTPYISFFVKSYLDAFALL